MKSILIVDISGKVINYDNALFVALAEKALESGANARLLLPGNGLLRLIPKRIGNSKSLCKRLIKVIEGFLNYTYIILLLLICKVDILHLQWLPFMEVTNWENAILKIIHFVSPQTKIVLTIHNIYPHNMSDGGKCRYRERFIKACGLIDAFIVHTNISKQDVIREFSIPSDKVSVACHGVFEPKGVSLNKEFRRDGKLHILQFGGQSYYKGTDVLVKAIDKLSTEDKSKIDVHIVGGINDKYLAECKSYDKDGIVTWKPYFLSDKELNDEINNCDLVVVPYRAISQSGVLLLAIYFQKLIICSNIPSFKETMRGNCGEDLDNYLLFENEDSDALSNLLKYYISDSVDVIELRKRIKKLKSLYSWASAAISTFKAYST